MEKKYESVIFCGFRIFYFVETPSSNTYYKQKDSRPFFLWMFSIFPRESARELPDLQVRL
jgi:hypothetical protein